MLPVSRLPVGSPLLTQRFSPAAGSAACCGHVLPVDAWGCAMDMGAKVESYLPLVGAIARTVRQRLPSSVEIDDLMQDGVLGLIGALHRYDPTRGVVFSTYAGHRIRGAMLDGLRARDPLPRAARRAQRAAGNDPAGNTGFQLLDLDHALSISADEETGPEALALESDLRRRLWAGFAALPVRDREVLLLRMVHDLPLRLVAYRLGLSITRAAELETRGITRLRRYLAGQPMIRGRSRAAGPAMKEVSVGNPNRPYTSGFTRPPSQAAFARQG
jgi:RNA polymerase sigma factor for flagellar operon FliA